MLKISGEFFFVHFFGKSSDHPKYEFVSAMLRFIIML